MNIEYLLLHSTIKIIQLAIEEWLLTYCPQLNKNEYWVLTIIFNDATYGLQINTNTIIANTLDDLINKLQN